MKRTDRYPDTKVFHWHNENPKGRITGDCCFRAMAVGLQQDYNTTVIEMAEMMCKTGYALNDKKGEEAYLKSKGIIKQRQPKKPDGTKYTGEEFCKKIAKKGKRYIAHIGGHHIVAIVNKQVWDTWDSTGRTIGNYWEMP